MDQLCVERPDQRDVGTYLRLRDAAAERMVAQGIEQWVPGEVTRERLREFGWADGLHVARLGDEVIGGVIVMWADPHFWGDRPEPAGYIHGLLVDSRHKGEGLGRQLLAWAEDHIAATGRTLSRLDTVTVNEALRGYYREAGYAEVGERVFEDGSVFGHGARIASCTLLEKRLG